MSKLKIDTRSLTDAMQNNADFVPTLMSALSATSAAPELAPQPASRLAPEQQYVTDERLTDERLTEPVASDAVLPSELRASVENERLQNMISNSTLS